VVISMATMMPLPETRAGKPDADPAPEPGGTRRPMPGDETSLS
jgi:hypothetical protein